MPSISVLVRNHFEPLREATGIPIAGNAYEIHIPRDSATLRLARRDDTLEAWDGAVFLIDGAESQPALGTGETKNHLIVTALLLG